MHPFIASSLLSLVLGLHETVNKHSLFTACLPFMMLQTSACPWSLIVSSTLCHGIKADYHQTQVLATLRCISSRSVWSLGISLCNAAICTNPVQRPSEGGYLSPLPAEGADGDGPQHRDFGHCKSLVGWIPDADSVYWSMFSYEHVGQSPPQASWGTRAFDCTVWDTAGTLPLEGSEYPLPTLRPPSNPPQNQPPCFCFANCVYCHRLDFSRA